MTLSTVAATSNAGTYTITASGAVDPNYTISYASGHADDRSGGVDDHGRQREHDLRRHGGDADGELHGLGQQRHGQQPDDGGDVGDGGGDEQRRARTRSRPAGRWIRTTRSATPAGTLTIGQAALTITADNQSMTYGGTAATLTASYTGLVNSDTASSLTTALTLSTVAATSNAGTYTITASGAVDPNYTISYASGTLTIGQAALTITADNQSMTYGGTAATLTASYTGLVNSDTASSLTTAVTLSTVAATSNAGHVHDHGERGGGSELHDQLRQRHADDRSGGVDDHGQQPEHDVRRHGGDADGELHGVWSTATRPAA